MAQRPESIAEYIGQDRIKALLAAELSAGHMPRHMLFYGLPGLGKTSLAKVVANEAGLKFVHWQASKGMTAKKLSADLMALPVDGYSADGTPSKAAPRYLVFIDEIHKLPEFETLYPVLEDRILNPDPFGGISWLPLCCFVVATTDPYLLPKPFGDRFPLKFRLDPYAPSEIATMVMVKFGIDADTALEIARRSRGNARDAVNYTESVLRHGLGYFDLMGIDDAGLTTLDRQVLEVLRKVGRPVSLNTLAAMVRENPTTLRDVVEPALLAAGLMEITPKGRQATGLTTAPQSRGVPIMYAR